jgi:hypothetical protein
MRVIGEISHPSMKITVFKMEHRLTVKFEDGMYEQAYKFRHSDELNTFEDVSKMIDNDFIQAVRNRFSEMRSDTEALTSRYFQPIGFTEEEII